VALTSRIDLAPEQTTTAGVRASCGRSAEISSVSANPRCTPPIPPVPTNRIPTVRLTASVPPTVVEPSAPCTTHAARSRAPTLRAVGPASAKRFRSVAVSPTRTAPSSTPTVAGVAPAARTRSSESSAAASPRPAENPCDTSVVSSATTGRPSLSAAATSSATCGAKVTALPPSLLPLVPPRPGRARRRRPGNPPRTRRQPPLRRPGQWAAPGRTSRRRARRRRLA
jgi:hypothetical protein